MFHSMAANGMMLASLRRPKESDVKYTILLALLLSVSLAWPAECPSHQSKDASALTEIEYAWANALDHHDLDALKCILATEFQDVNTEGQMRDRAQTLAGAAKRMPGTDKLSDLEPKVQGDMGYIRGTATLIDAQGKTVAQVRFTDVYIYRSGRWQAVAGQETLVSAEKK